jgi:hypothetical protein
LKKQLLPVLRTAVLVVATGDVGHTTDGSTVSYLQGAAKEAPHEARGRASERAGGWAGRPDKCVSRSCLSLSVSQSLSLCLSPPLSVSLPLVCLSVSLSVSRSLSLGVCEGTIRGRLPRWHCTRASERLSEVKKLKTHRNTRKRV